MKDGALGVEGEKQHVHPASASEPLRWHPKSSLIDSSELSGAVPRAGRGERVLGGKRIARPTAGDGRYMAVESRFKTAVFAIFTVFGSGSTEKAVGFSASGLRNFKSTRMGPQRTQEHGVGGA